MTHVNIGGRLVDISTPSVMTIINLTPDSFFRESCVSEERIMLKRIEMALEEGARFIDIGACSTRPGGTIVSQQDEINRLTMAIKAIKSHFGTSINISIDTFRSDAVIAVSDIWQDGFIVNDIKSAKDQDDMLKIVGERSLPYIAMHGGSEHLLGDKTTKGDDIIESVTNFFVERLKKIREYGIKDTIFDVGFGFAKSKAQNFELIASFDKLKILGIPQLVGVSRKRMVWQTLDSSPEEALNGTSVLNTLLLERGAKILRVHDTRAAIECITLYNELNNL